MEYPATADVTTPEELDRWRALVQWFLAIPHLVISAALSYAAEAVAVVSWFIILFTGKLPDGLAKFQIMTIRYSIRAGSYAGFLHDQYPPFEFPMSATDPGGAPTTLTIEPQLEDRNRVTVGFRIILAIPVLLFSVLIGIVAFLCWIGAFFAVLFTGRWPEGLRAWVMKSLRVWTRTQAYMYLLVDEYPPFSTD